MFNQKENSPASIEESEVTIKDSSLLGPGEGFVLHGASPEHEFTPEGALTDWRTGDRIRVDFSHHEITQSLIDAAQQHTTLSLYYHGGTDTGRLRKFTPECVFRISSKEFTYVGGYCHLRRSHRVLRTDRISLA